MMFIFDTSDRFVSEFPLMKISEEILEAWTQGDLTRTEQMLTAKILDVEDPSRHSQCLAQRSLVRSRLKQYNLALDDAQKVAFRLSLVSSRINHRTEVCGGSAVHNLSDCNHNSPVSQ
jgi:hypothetical protein